MNDSLFKITNLGSIKSNYFEFKPLTVFCGTDDINKHMIMYATYQIYNKLSESKSNNLSTMDLASLFNIPYQKLNNTEFNFVYNNLKLDEYNNVLLLPIERNAIIALHNEFNERYCPPINDYITWAKNIFKNDPPQSTRFKELIENIEQLLNGSYEIKDNTYLFHSNDGYTYGPQNDFIPQLHKSLFPIWYFLKYQSCKNDILMIEYPEMGLHPENQVKLSKILIQIVNNGIHLIITTHSDYIIREFNNMIMLNQDNGYLKNKYNYTENEILDPNNISAYMFKNDSIEKCEISEFEGVNATTFDEIIEKTNEINNDIYYYLQENQ